MIYRHLFPHFLFMNCIVLCISSMCDWLPSLTLDQKYRGLKNHVKSANVSLLKIRQQVKSKGNKTKRQTKSAPNMKTPSVKRKNTKQLQEQETSSLMETTTKKRENTGDEQMTVIRKHTHTHTKQA